MRRRLSAAHTLLATCLFGSFWSLPALAEEESDVGDELDAPEAGDTTGASAELDDALTASSAREVPGKTYYFLGARYRGVVVPQFMQNLFADGGRTAYVHGFGPEVGMRRNGFEYNLSSWLALYSLDETPYKGSNDGDEAWEIIESELKILYFTADFLWSHPFSHEVSMVYGPGFGLGIVFGDLFRTQAFPGSGGVDDPDSYVKCQRVGQHQFCDNDNDHYDGYTEPSWFNAGSKPVVFPWLTLQTGLRFKPSKEFVGRLDVGFGTSGFFFGLGADYGL